MSKFCKRCHMRNWLCKGSCKDKTLSDLAADRVKREVWFWVTDTCTKLRKQYNLYGEHET